MNLADMALRYEVQLTELYDIEEAKSLYLIVIEHLFGYSKASYILKKNETINSSNIIKLEQLLHQLNMGKPIQYILGETEFYGLKFRVNPAVLIPRPETEELVNWILEVCKATSLNNADKSALNILDVGTGSGCIAISLKKQMPEATLSALDISAEALATAKGNAQLNEVDINFVQQDFLNLNSYFKVSALDLIVSNPPYVKESEKPGMHQNVLSNEPHTALFVTNHNPLVFYNAIADFALKYLRANGLLFFEINEHLGGETVDLLRDKGFVGIELKKDMQGKNRMIKATLG